MSFWTAASTLDINFVKAENDLLTLFSNNLVHCLFPNGILGNAGDAISLWASRDGTDFTAQGSSNQPTVALCGDNATRVADFNGTAHTLSLQNAKFARHHLSATGVTYFTVFRCTDFSGAPETIFNLRFPTSKTFITAQLSNSGQIQLSGRILDANSLATVTYTSCIATVRRWHLLIVQVDPVTGNATVTLDNTTQTLAFNTPNATLEPAVALNDSQIGSIGGTANYFTGQIAAFGAISRLTTTHERAHIQSILRRAFPVRNFVVMHGDSFFDMRPAEFTVLNEFQRPRRVIQRLLSPSNKFLVRNEATSGKGLSAGFNTPHALTEAGTRIDPLLSPPLCNRRIVMSNFGYNDMSQGRTSAQITADIETYAAARKTAGWNRVVWMLPFGTAGQGTSAAAERTMRTIYNNLKATPGSIDQLVDVRLNAPQLDCPLVGNVASVDTSTDTLVMNSVTGLTTGDRVRIDSTGTVPAGTSTSTIYFANRSGLNVTLHTSNADAIAGTNKVDITDAGSGTHSLFNMNNPFNSTFYLNNASPYAPDNFHPSASGIALYAPLLKSGIDAVADLSA